MESNQKLYEIWVKEIAAIAAIGKQNLTTDQHGLN
jgi:hypothetical protein